MESLDDQAFRHEPVEVLAPPLGMAAELNQVLPKVGHILDETPRQKSIIAGEFSTALKRLWTQLTCCEWTKRFF